MRAPSATHRADTAVAARVRSSTQLLPTSRDRAQTRQERCRARRGGEHLPRGAGPRMAAVPGFSPLPALPWAAPLKAPAPGQSRPQPRPPSERIMSEQDWADGCGRGPEGRGSKMITASPPSQPSMWFRILQRCISNDHYKKKDKSSPPFW